MKITIQMTDEELGEALKSYLAPRGLAYVSHTFVDDNDLQIEAQAGVLPVAAATPAAPLVHGAATAQPRGAGTNPALPMSELRFSDPDTVEGTPPHVDHTEEIAAVLRDMSSLPEVPPGLSPTRR